MFAIRAENRKSFGKRWLLLFLPGLILLVGASVYPLSKVKNGVVGIPAQHIGNRISSCKSRKGEVTSQLLEADIEKYRRGESDLGGIFLCREVFPTLKKYALDPDPKVREALAYYLSLHYSTEALQLLIQQIETYPLHESADLYHDTLIYPCYFFKKVKVRSLTQTLAAHIKTRDDDENGDKIRLLGCLAPKDAQARKFLEEMSQPSFATRLSESDRQDQLNILTYALAEAGNKEAEEKVLAEIQAATATGQQNAIQSALDKVHGFTNCRIIQRFALLIVDKRAVSLEVFDEGKIKQFQGRIGDMAISTFSGALGTQLTGEKDVRWKPHTDAEMERVYRRVGKALASGKFSTCQPSQ